MADRRFDYIDAVRGIAIAGVILAHAASITKVSGPLRQVTYLGGMGVELFFVVSAFTIFLTYSRAVEREDHPVRNFFIRRLMRIVPVYWLGIFLYTAFFGLGSRGWRDGPELWHYPLHLTLTNIFSPTAMSSVVPGGWSISVEVMFYFTVPLWFLLVRNLRQAITFTILAMAAGLVITKLGVTYLTLPGVSPALKAEYFYRSYPSQLACFGFGMILFYLQPVLAGLDRKRAVSLILLGFSALCAAAVFLRLVPKAPHYQMALAFLFLASGLALVPWPAIVNRATILLGRISYSAYLLHFLVIKGLVTFLPLGGLSPVQKFAVILPLAFICTIPLAYQSYLHVEQETSRLARKWIDDLKNRTGPTAA